MKDYLSNHKSPEAQPNCWSAAEKINSIMKSILLAGIFLLSFPLIAQENPTNLTSKDSISKIEDQKLKEVTVYGNKKQFLKVSLK